MMRDIADYQFFKILQSLPFIEEIWLFGSRTREDNMERADIDLAILCPQASDIDWIKIMDIVEDADTLLNIDCLRFDPNRLSPELYKNIKMDKKIIYVKKPS